MNLKDQRLFALFHQALDHDREERERFLSDVAAENAVLGAELRELLVESDDDEFNFLGELPGRLAARLLAEEESEVGRRVGPYRLQAELGRGGLGVVYLAKREEADFEQKVAVKRLKRGLDSDEFLRRFQLERQSLARLEHPAITRLIDGGVANDGRPFLAMEYIEGHTLDRYCQEENLGLAARLRLFIEIGDAVSFIHRNLIVHRDLKPSNVLVTEEGAPKLLDFNIVKLLDPQAVDGSRSLTTHDKRPMTARYASPEQARGEPVGTATDIYSLGVMLYELLTGRRPYRLDGLSGQALVSALEQEALILPSQAVGEASEPGLSKPPVEGASLARSLAGDLDTIVLKAMAKVEGERYGSVQELTEDIRLHLAGYPIRARTASKLYRLAKFLRRHRWGAAMAASFLLLILVFSTMTSLQARRLERERATAQQVSDFLLEVFGASDLYASSGNAVTARELLDAGTALIKEKLTEQPVVQAKLMTLMGRAYHSVGEYDTADQLLQRALELNRSIYDEYHREVADGLDHLGQLRRSQGRLKESETFQRQALAIRQRVLPVDDPDLAFSLNNLGVCLRDLGRFEEAEELYRQALDLNRHLSGDRRASIASNLNNLGSVLAVQGEYAEAERFHRQALAIRRELFEKPHMNVAMSLNNLAKVLQSRGEFVEGEALLRESLELRQLLLGDEHPAVATALNNLGSAQRLAGDYRGAENLYRQALAMRERLLGPDHFRVAISMGGLALLFKETGRFEKAEALYRQSLKILDQGLGKNHSYYTMGAMNLASLLTLTGEYTEAESLLLQVLDIRLRASGPEHPHVAHGLSHLGVLRLHQGDDLEAERFQREALEIRQEAFGGNSVEVAHSLSALANVCFRRADYDLAEPFYRRALTIFQERLGRRHLSVAVTLNNLANLETERGRHERAKRMHLEALTIFLEKAGEGHPQVAIIRSNLAATLNQKGEFTQAESLIEEALRNQTENLPPGHWRIGQSESVLGECLTGLGRYQEAEVLLLRSLETLQDEKSISTSLPVQRTLKRLVALHEARQQPKEAARFGGILREIETKVGSWKGRDVS